MTFLRIEQQKSFENVKMCQICKEIFEDKHDKDKKYHKVRDHGRYTGEFRGSAHTICNLKYSAHKEILIVVRNRFKYDYHFVIKEEAEEYEKEFTCLGSTKKYINFSVPIETDIVIVDKSGKTFSKDIS